MSTFAVWIAALLFGFGVGAGAMATERLWPWLVVMGRACRFWFTIPEESHPLYRDVRKALLSYGKPRWYARYVAFRETGHIIP